MKRNVCKKKGKRAQDIVVTSLDCEAKRKASQSEDEKKTPPKRIFKKKEKKELKVSKKKSYHEGRWAASDNKNLELFHGIDALEVIKVKKIVEEKKEEPDSLFRCFRTEKSENTRNRLLNAGVSLEITKTGVLRTDDEIIGIMRAKEAFAKKQKQKKRQGFKVAKKQRTLERKGIVIADKPVATSTAKWKAEQKALALKQQKEKSVPLYTKAQKKEFRAMKDRQKLLKRKKKDDRRQTNHGGVIRTEAGIFPVEDFSAINAFRSSIMHSDIAQHFNNKETKDTALILLYLHQMYESPSFRLDCSVSASFALAYAGFDFTHFAAFSSLSIFKCLRGRRRVKTESFSDAVDFFSRSFEVLLESEFFVAIRTVVLIAVGWKLFDRDFSHFIFRNFGVFGKRLTNIEAVSAIFASIQVFIKIGEGLLNGLPLSSLLLDANPVRSALDSCDDLLARSNLLYYGLPKEDHMCAKAYVKEANEVLGVLNHALKNKQPFSCGFQNLRDKTYKLIECRKAVMGSLTRGLRIPPIGVIIHGPPGIGKSTIVNMVYQIFSHVKGRVYDPCHVFERVVISPYWDGYDPVGTPIIHLSEVGSTAANIVRTRGDPAVQELTSLVDTLPFVCNMSSVEDKGRVSCLAELVVVDTNNPNLNLEYIVTNPSAYARRFIYIEPTVKQKYVKKGTSALDPKIEGEFYDKWTFKVSTKVPINLKHSKTEIVLDNGDVKEFERTLSQMFEDTIETNDNVRKQASRSLYDSPMVQAGEFLSGLFNSEGGVIGSYVKGVGRRLCETAYSSCILAVSTCNSFMLNFLLTLYALPHPARGAACLMIVLLLYYLGLLTPFLIITVYLACTVDIYAFTVKQIERRIRHEKNVFYTRLRRVKDNIYGSFIYLFGGEAGPMVTFCSYALPTLAIAMAFVTYMFRKTRDTEASEYLPSGPVYDEIRVVEDHYNCGNSYERVPIKNTKIWNNVVISPSTHQGELQGLHGAIMRNCRLCRVFNGDKCLKTYCLGVGSSYALINLHALGNKLETFDIEILCKGNFCDSGAVIRANIRRCDLVQVCKDIVLIDIGNICFSDITMHFPLEDVRFKNVKGMIGREEIRAHWFADKLTADDKFNGSVDFGSVITYVWMQHAPGSCGLPIVARRDSGSCIVGVHSAGTSGSGDCYGVVVLRGALREAMSKLCSSSPFQILSEAECVQGAMPHFKSPVRYEDLGPITYYGSVSQPNMNQRSKLSRTIFSKHLAHLFFDKLGYQRLIYYEKPLMQPVMRKGVFMSPYNYNLRKICVSKKSLSRGRLLKSIDIVYDQLFNNLSKRDIPKLTPLTLEVAMNGMNTDAWLRAVNFNKAAGFGTPGPKSAHCYRTENRGPWDFHSITNEELTREILKIIDCYRRGQNYGPVFKAQLKDEPRDRDKVAIGKTRIFYSTPFAFLIVQRMFLAPLYTLMVQFSRDFYTGLGVDMHRDAHDLYDFLTSFSDDIFEGDYGGYDQSMPFEIGMGANAIILKLLSELGYSDEQLLITRGLLSDNLFPRVEMLGELFQIPGLQPSGKYATAEDNSLRNLLIMVYMWLSFPESEGKSFFDHVRPLVYGDDVIAAVKDADFFNAISYSETCEELTNLVFTSSSKGNIEHPYLSPSEMSFLKRTFVYYEPLGRIVAPLALDSIYKTLEWMSPSEINIESHHEMLVNSSLRELFFHMERKKYGEVREVLGEILAEEFPESKFDLISYDQILDSLFICPIAMPVQGGRQAAREVVVTESAVIPRIGSFAKYSEITTWGFGRPLDRFQWPAEVKKLLNEVELEMKEVEYQFRAMVNPLPGCCYRQAKQNMLYSSSPGFGRECDVYFAFKARLKALELTANRLRSAIDRSNRSFNVVTESGIESEMTNQGDISTQTDVHQNVSDVAGDAGDYDPQPEYTTINVGQDNVLDMSVFLERPLAVTSFSVAPGSLVNYNVDLWDYVLSHPSIRAKIRNYAYIRAKMNVRIAISGTPFHYGKVLVSYQPLAGFNENLNIVDSELSLNRSLSLTYLSQSPYSRVMDIKSNKPLEMEFPFISPQPVLRLFNKSPLIIPEGSPFNDAVGFGKLYVQSLNPVRCASATPSDVSVFIYAYMTDVQLGAPTGTVLTVGTESGKDERMSGPIEKVATRASEIAYKLTTIPVIGPYAKASAVTLGGLGSLAALFGFSVPTMENEPTRVKNQAFQNGTHVIGYDTGKRITLDPKQELSVDPRCVQRETDDMSLAYISSRESYLDTFAWEESTVPLSTSIWMAPVNPSIVKAVPTGPSAFVVAPTALSFCATPFDVWRGDIQFRFEIVCSKYHRGKLAFYFEPNISQNVVIDTVLDMNKQFIKVIDIQEVQDISFTVNWAFPRAWAKVLPASLLGDLGTVGFLGPQLSEYANGYVAVTPFTSLQSPDGSDISVNVYISSANMMFNQAIDANFPTARPTTESGELSSEEVTMMDLNVSSADISQICEEHYGEMPVSFRALLKRFNSVKDYEAPTGDATIARTVRVSDISNYPKVIPSYDGSSGSSSLYGYLRYAFIGIRGGTRRRFQLVGDVEYGRNNVILVRLDPPSAADIPYTVVYSSNLNAFESLYRGSILFVPHVNGGFEYEVPLYTNNLFGMSFSEDPFPTTSIVENNLTRSHSIRVAISKSPDTNVYYQSHFAAGDDFSMFGYQGAPLFVYSS